MSDQQQLFDLIYKTIKTNLSIESSEAHKLAYLLHKAIDREFLFMLDEEEETWYKEKDTSQKH